MTKLLNKLRHPLLALLTLLHLTTPQRIVMALSPIFVAGSGLVLVAAAHLGVHDLTVTKLTVVFVAGATFAATKLLVWLHGSQKATASAATDAANIKIAKIHCSHVRGQAANVENLAGSLGSFSAANYNEYPAVLAHAARAMGPDEGVVYGSCGCETEDGGCKGAAEGDCCKGEPVGECCKGEPVGECCKDLAQGPVVTKVDIEAARRWSARREEDRKNALLGARGPEETPPPATAVPPRRI
jgi:hypothetical protein